jgi:hypothetical protein
MLMKDAGRRVDKRVRAVRDSDLDDIVRVVG